MDRRDQLRDFLKTRRARLTPADVGLPDAGQRRTPGLRREEVAVLAGVGVSWYTWLEQGRDIKVSAQVLDAIGDALRLDAHEHTYLYRLAGLNPPSATNGSVGPLNPGLHRLLAGWLPLPAYILDQHWSLAAVNSMARTVFGLSDRDHNCLVAFFASSRYRAAFTRWDAAAPDIVARFRADAAKHPGDPEFQRLVTQLSAVSPEFAELWAAHDVTETAQGRKFITHPHAGELVFEYTRLPLPDHPGYDIVLHNPAPDTDTMARLESLTVEQLRTG
ncbi:helix-turn-helix transcriptional regulator [Nocardia goodfellowii]|uniref:Transcriptional regulator with XRE-family HTH domain n=1 Tax=Nocardia goodfellowii TaxID=882446 RepID=A0ABS4QK53_9NOCA|nr:helix-turn-helix transcriptional regulator [Nocardia goodfellowii]MBP2192087.1 transcriptional regulator with XRE-family HTH domain [Nocardia goodfellowii]